MKQVAILGGGIAGLAAAYELMRRGDVEAVLFEASPRLGGIIETAHEGGFVIEGGPDGWVSEKPWARELVEELGLGGEIIASLDAGRKTYILQRGRLVAMPQGMRMMVPGDIDAMRSSELFSDEAKRACEEEPARAAELLAAIPAEDESVAAFVRRHFGEEMLRKVGAPLLSGVFGGDVERLSVRAVMPQFVAMEKKHGSLIAAVQTNAQQKKTASASIFSSLRGGMGTLVDTLIEKIPSGWVRLNKPVRSLQRKGAKWLVDGEPFDAVFVASPVDVAQRLLADVDPDAAELMQMEASSAVTVAFGYPEHFELPAGFGFLAPEGEGTQLLACTFTDQKFPHRVAAGGRMLRAFFGGSNGERMCALDDASLITLAQQELAAILGPLLQPVVTRVRRLPRSLPQYAVGHLERMAELDRRVQALEGIRLLGSGYRGVGLPDIIRDARAAAQSI